MIRTVLILCAGMCVWANADVISVPGEYLTIQAALDASGANDTIVVSPDTYTENIVFPPHAVTLTSTDPNNPSIVATTIIDGSNPVDPNYGSTVTFNAGQGNETVLEGFTVTGGTGTWLAIAWRFHEVYWNRCGGGIVCYNLSQPTIRKNRITNNLAGEGGGLYVYGNPVDPNSPTDPPVHIQPVIDDNLFENNNAITDHGYDPPDTIYTLENHGDGGAIVCFQGVDPQFTNNLVKNNHADWYGGGVHLRQWSDGLIEDNLIQNNDSRLGAGIHITYTSDPTVRKNQIIGNVAGGLGGGGVYVYYFSNPIIEQNLVTKNESPNAAGIGIYYDSFAIIRNNIITANVKGQGIFITGDSNSHILSNTIVANEGSGIKIFSDIPINIENNIIASNGLYGIESLTETPNTRYNNIWGNITDNYDPSIGDQTGINGNINKDPLFEIQQDYHLSKSSPCINAGDPNYPATPDLKDYDGQIRVMGEFIDIGADEIYPVWNSDKSIGYLTIQQAIDDANSFDIIILTMARHKGDGNRDIDFNGKAVTVQGTDPSDPDVIERTIIDCEGSLDTPHRGFNFHSGENNDSVIKGITITGGEGVHGAGAIRCVYSSSPTISHCIIQNNKGKDFGGGIYCGYNSSPIISNCLITENSFNPYGYGAGIFCYNNSSPTIINCIITNNTVLGNAPLGHGRHGGGICCFGISETTGSNPVVANCIIAGNTAEHRGGGVYAYWSNPIFVNCTIVGNRAYEGGGAGSFREAHPKLYNCIVRDNIAEIGNQIALISTIRLWPWEEITEMTVSNSNIEGWALDDDIWVDPNMILHVGGGNIDVDPNFVDAGHWDNAGTPADPNDDIYTLGNYHLMPTSSCVNVGANAFVPSISTNDIDDEQRIFNANVDMGADEVYFSPADFNTDGWVDIVDLGTIATEWLSDEMPLQTDLTEDNFIDFYDLAEFSANWLWTGKWLD